MTKHAPIYVGTHGYIITGAMWDCAAQIGRVFYEDDNGIKFVAEGGGLARHEQRQAVVDDIMRRGGKED